MMIRHTIVNIRGNVLVVSMTIPGPVEQPIGGTATTKITKKRNAIKTRMTTMSSPKHPPSRLPPRNYVKSNPRMHYIPGTGKRMALAPLTHVVMFTEILRPTHPTRLDVVVQVERGGTKRVWILKKDVSWWCVTLQQARTRAGGRPAPDNIVVVVRLRFILQTKKRRGCRLWIYQDVIIARLRRENMTASVTCVIPPHLLWVIRASNRVNPFIMTIAAHRLTSNRVNLSTLTNATLLDTAVISGRKLRLQRQSHIPKSKFLLHLPHECLVSAEDVGVAPNHWPTITIYANPKKGSHPSDRARCPPARDPPEPNGRPVEAWHAVLLAALRIEVPLGPDVK